MTDEQIGGQITRSCQAALVRYDTATTGQYHGLDFNDRAVTAEFLSGMMLVANFLCRTDGEVTAQQMERAISMVAKDCGLTMGREQQ